jgi:hypothetical protein
VARPNREFSNSLFDILTEWNSYLDRRPYLQCRTAILVPI